MNQCTFETARSTGDRALILYLPRHSSNVSSELLLTLRRCCKLATSIRRSRQHKQGSSLHIEKSAVFATPASARTLSSSKIVGVSLRIAIEEYVRNCFLRKIKYFSRSQRRGASCHRRAQEDQLIQLGSVSH